MKATFNGDFYVAVATVIPLFYLALAFQGPWLQDLLSYLKDTATALENAPNPWKILAVHDMVDDLSASKWLKLAHTWETYAKPPAFPLIPPIS
jgi:hypothetical protein